MKHHLKPKIKY